MVDVQDTSVLDEQPDVVEVRYRATVYARVNLNTGEVESVMVDAESPRLDYLPSEDPINDPGQDVKNPLDVVEQTYAADGTEVDVEITDAIAKQAVDIAEAAEWPQWEID